MFLRHARDAPFCPVQNDEQLVEKAKALLKNGGAKVFVPGANDWRLGGRAAPAYAAVEAVLAFIAAGGSSFQTGKCCPQIMDNLGCSGNTTTSSNTCGNSGEVHGLRARYVIKPCPPHPYSHVSLAARGAFRDAVQGSTDPALMDLKRFVDSLEMKAETCGGEGLEGDALQAHEFKLRVAALLLHLGLKPLVVDERPAEAWLARLQGKDKVVKAIVSELLNLDSGIACRFKDATFVALRLTDLVIMTMCFLGHALSVGRGEFWHNFLLYTAHAPTPSTVPSSCRTARL